MDRQKRKIMHSGMIVALVLALATFSFAEQDKEVKKEKIETTSAVKEVQGEISAIAKDSISIIYQRDAEKGIEYEIVLPLEEKNVQLVHKNNLNQFKAGDLVEVQYEEITEEYKEGQKSKRSANIIRFVKSATK